MIRGLTHQLVGGFEVVVGRELKLDTDLTLITERQERETDLRHDAEVDQSRHHDNAAQDLPGMFPGPFDTLVELTAQPIVSHIPWTEETVEIALDLPCFFLPFEHHTGKNGGQRKTDEKRNQRCGDHHTGKRLHQAADTGGHHHHRNKHDHVGQCTGGNSSNHLGSALFGGNLDRFIFIKVLEDIFDHHDGVCNKHTHRTAEGQQGHNIEGVIQILHQRKCNDHRNRHGNHNDKGGTGFMQKEEKQNGGQSDTHYDTAPRIVHRSLNECTGIFEPYKFHAGWEHTAGFEFFKLLANPFDHLNGVGFPFFNDGKTGRGFSVHIGFAAGFTALQFDFGNVTQIDAFVFKCTDFERLDLFKILEVAVESNVLFVLIELNASQRFANIVGFEFGNNSIDRDIHGTEFGAVQQNMDLHFIRTVNTHLPHTRHSGKTVGDTVIGKVVKVILRTVTDEKRLHHRRCVGVDLADHRFIGPIGKIIADTVDRFTDIRSGDIHICPHIEFQLDTGFVFHGKTGNVLDAVQRRNGILDAFDHLNFDFRGTGTLIFTADQHRWDLHIRKQVDAQLRIKTRPDHHQNDDECRHGDGTLYGPFAQKHAAIPLLFDDLNFGTVIDISLSGNDHLLAQQSGSIFDFAEAAVDDALFHDDILSPVFSIHRKDDTAVVGTEQNGVRRQSISFFFFQHDIEFGEHTGNNTVILGNEDLQLESTAGRINTGRLICHDRLAGYISAVIEEMGRRFSDRDLMIINCTDVADDFKSGMIFQFEDLLTDRNIFIFFGIGFRDDAIKRSFYHRVFQILSGDGKVAFGLFQLRFGTEDARLGILDIGFGGLEFGFSRFKTGETYRMGLFEPQCTFIIRLRLFEMDLGGIQSEFSGMKISFFHADLIFLDDNLIFQHLTVNAEKRISFFADIAAGNFHHFKSTADFGGESRILQRGNNALHGDLTA